MSHSVNYLLISHPGMGKTSLIRAIGTKLNSSIHGIDAVAMEAFLSRMRRNITLESHTVESYIRSVRIIFPTTEQVEYIMPR